MMGEMGIKFPDNIVFSNERNYIMISVFIYINAVQAKAKA